MLGRVGVGAGQQEDVVGVLGLRGPYLLSVDHPFVAVQLGPRLEAGQVRPGVGLAEALAPGDLAFEDARDELLLLLLGAPLQEGRARRACRRRSRARSGAPARANSSLSTTCSSRVRPLPPYSAGQLAQIHPPAKSLAVHSSLKAVRSSRRHGEAGLTPALGQVLLQPSAISTRNSSASGGYARSIAARYPSAVDGRDRQRGPVCRPRIGPVSMHSAGNPSPGSLPRTGTTEKEVWPCRGANPPVADPAHAPLRALG